MFRSALNRVLDWAELALAWEDECAAGEDGEVDGGIEAPPAAAHPHRRPLRWDRQRRLGARPHPVAECASPVSRRSGGKRVRDASVSEGLLFADAERLSTTQPHDLPS